MSTRPAYPVIGRSIAHGARVHSRRCYRARAWHARAHARHAGCTTPTPACLPAPRVPAAQLPAGWTTAVSKSSGEAYYVNSATGESQFEFPDAPIVGAAEELPPPLTQTASAEEREAAAAAPTLVPADDSAAAVPSAQEGARVLPEGWETKV